MPWEDEDTVHDIVMAIRAGHGPTRLSVESIILNANFIMPDSVGEKLTKALADTAGDVLRVMFSPKMLCNLHWPCKGSRAGDKFCVPDTLRDEFQRVMASKVARTRVYAKAMAAWRDLGDSRHPKPVETWRYHTAAQQGLNRIRKCLRDQESRIKLN